MKNIFIQLRALYRFLSFLLIIQIYILFGACIYITNYNQTKRRHKLIYNGRRFCRIFMKFFNVKLICKNPISKNENSLLIGNHVGFIDILCLQSIEPAVFITSLEMKRTPGLGQICEIGGCTYVNRKNRMKIQDELQNVVNVLKAGFRVVLYAESVASNGEQVLPFKKTLMMSAAIAQVPIRPFVFNFVKINNKPIQYKYRDSVCWYGDQQFIPAIWRSLQLDSVTCEIEFLPLVEVNITDDRSVVAAKIHKMVSDKYKPFKPDL